MYAFIIIYMCRVKETQEKFSHPLRKLQKRKGRKEKNVHTHVYNKVRTPIPIRTHSHSHPAGKPQKEKQKTERKKSDRKKKKEKKQKKNSSFTKFVPHLVNSMCVREAFRAGKWSLSAPSPSSHSQFQNKNFRVVKYFYSKKNNWEG